MPNKQKLDMEEKIKIGRGDEEGCLSQVRQSHLYKVIKEYCEESEDAVEETCDIPYVSRAVYYRWVSGSLLRRHASMAEQSSCTQNAS